MKSKKLSSLPIAVAVAAALAAGQGFAEDPQESVQPTTGEASAPLAGNFYFTDEQGNPRNPSAEELIAAGNDFQRDLARIAGNRQTEETTHANGATSAVVALSKLSFLVAETDEDGNLVMKHGALDENGEIVTATDAELPEM